LTCAMRRTSNHGFMIEPETQQIIDWLLWNILL
jgi:hypothetical protein